MIHALMTTGNAEADQINQNVVHGIGMVFQGAWDIASPFVAAGFILFLIVLGIRHIAGGRGRR